MKKLILMVLSVSYFGCDDIIEVTDISDETVTVLAPKNGALIEDTDIIFSWGTIDEAESYNIQIAQPSFEAAAQILTDSLVTHTAFNKTLDSGAYQWRVRAENSEYATLYTTQGFTVSGSIVDISSTSVVISSPEDNATFATTETISFSWGAIDGATEYEIQIVTPNFDSPTQTIEDTTISETTFSASNLSAGNYQWRVKAKNAIYQTNYSIQNFAVQ